MSVGTDLTQIIGWGEPAPDLGPGPDPDPQLGSNDTDALDIAFLSRVDGALTLTEDWFA